MKTECCGYKKVLSEPVALYKLGVLVKGLYCQVGRISTILQNLLPRQNFYEEFLNGMVVQYYLRL